MKPLLKYRGGKSKEIKHIEKHIPEYGGKYIEPFLGGGSLYFYLQPSIAIINDINSKLIDFYLGVKNNYKVLRNELDEVGEIYKINRKIFEKAKQKTPNDRVVDDNEILYYSIREMFNNKIEKKYSDSFLYFFINKTAYSGMIRYNSKGKFNVPYGRYINFNTSLVTNSHHDLLKSAEIYNYDYRKIFEMAKKDDFMFLDPPYDCVFSDYGNIEYKDGFNEKSHIKLAKDFRNLKCKSLMAISKTPLTEKLYGDLIIDEYEKSYAVNIKNRFKSVAKHILITNY